MMVVGVAYCFMRGYDGQMFTICMGVYLYKTVDALADVYEGRLQQADKMYLAGLSQALRSVAVVVAFSLLLLVTHAVVVHCLQGVEVHADGLAREEAGREQHRVQFLLVHSV